MLKSLFAPIAALFAGFILFGSATEANAHYVLYRHHHHGGYGHSGCCGPVPPTYMYKTSNKVTHVTRYRDVSRTHYVYRPHRIIHVTQIRPIVYIHSVTRVHHHTVGIVRPVYQHETRYLPTRTVYSSSVTNTYSCSCGCHHHRRY